MPILSHQYQSCNINNPNSNSLCLNTYTFMGTSITFPSTVTTSRSSNSTSLSITHSTAAGTSKPAATAFSGLLTSSRNSFSTKYKFSVRKSNIKTAVRKLYDC